MLTVLRVKQAVLVGDWLVDLKDEYFQIPIWEGHRRFLKFTFNGFNVQGSSDTEAFSLHSFILYY